MVRVSGPEAVSIVSKLFRGRRSLDSLRRGRVAKGWIAVGEADVDEVLVVVFRAPKSYTGEDLVEISCHGGPAAGYVLEALIDSGARPAEPGEFTKRAFLNGRIDLTQAEAISAVVAARGRASHRAALRLLKGQLREQLEPVYNDLLSHLARLEAHIEFPEDLEDDDPKVRDGYYAYEDGATASRRPPTPRELSSLGSILSRILAQAGRSDLLSNGFRIVLSGPVNVGKSSLFNRFLNRRRAIVTEEPGTTRDVLEGTVELGGIAVTFVDTAGLRPPSSRSEAEGTKRSVEERMGADLLLEVRDGSSPADLDDVPESGSPESDDFEPGRILVLNKIDLGLHPSWKEHLDRKASQDGHGVSCGETVPSVSGSTARPFSLQAPTALSTESWLEALEVSATTGAGVDTLQETIARRIKEAPAEEILLNLRQRKELRGAAENIASAVTSLGEGELPEIVSCQLNEAALALGSVLGRNPSDELMDAIFSQFCIGK